MIRLCSASIGENDFSDVFGATLDPGIAAQAIGAAGNYRADFNAVLKQMLKVGFSLRDLSAIEVPVLSTGKLFYRAEVAGGVAASDYISVTSGTDLCMVVPQGISWSAGGHAQLSVLMHFLSTDGAAAPVTIGTANGDLTGISNVYVADLDCVESININFGYELRFCQDGKLYPQDVFVVGQRPSMTIVTSDQAQVTTGNVAPGTVSALVADFAKVAEGGVRGAVRRYSLTGHVTRSVSGDRPGLVTLSCQGKGGFTVTDPVV